MVVTMIKMMTILTIHSIMAIVTLPDMTTPTFRCKKFDMVVLTVKMSINIIQLTTKLINN